MNSSRNAHHCSDLPHRIWLVEELGVLAHLLQGQDVERVDCGVLSRDRDFAAASVCVGVIEPRS